MRGPRHELHADQARYLDGVKFKPNSKAYQKYQKNMCNKMRPRIASLLMFVRAHDMSAGDGALASCDPGVPKRKSSWPSRLGFAVLTSASSVGQSPRHLGLERKSANLFNFPGMCCKVTWPIL